MATVTSRRAEPNPKIVAEYTALCAERVDIKIARAGDDAREEQIDARLKQIATDLGDSFTVAIPDKGEVKFSGAVAAECKGEQPILQTEFWLAMTAAERRHEVKRGLIKIEPQWGRPSSGRVAVKVFAATVTAR
jgi:hypothetical protein